MCDDFKVLEMECLKPQSPVLLNIGLSLLKFVSSHRGLTYVLLDLPCLSIDDSRSI